MIKYILILAIIAGMVSCFPEDTAVQPYERGDKEIGSAGMGEFYTTQIYYDLSTNSEVFQHSVLDWDLGFSSLDGQFAIYTNYGRFSKVHNFGQTPFEFVTKQLVNELTEDDWVFDDPEGSPDSTAIGQWWKEKFGDELISKNDVYVINRIRDEKGLFYSSKKFQILDYFDGKYSIRFADLDGSNEDTLIFEKDPIINQIYVSLDGYGARSLQPASQLWDIQFSRFTEELYESDTILVWYSVTTPVINDRFVEAALESEKSFEDITAENIENYQFSSNRNAISHTWKFYNLEEGQYYVDPSLNYIIKDTEGFYYKLHFVDFYNDEGKKGYPKFEFRKL